MWGPTQPLSACSEPLSRRDYTLRPSVLDQPREGHTPGSSITAILRPLPPATLTCITLLSSDALPASHSFGRPSSPMTHRAHTPPFSVHRLVQHLP
jgi:hypothetical protein